MSQRKNTQVEVLKAGILVEINDSLAKPEFGCNGALPALQLEIRRSSVIRKPHRATYDVVLDEKFTYSSSDTTEEILMTSLTNTELAIYLQGYKDGLF